MRAPIRSGVVGLLVLLTSALVLAVQPRGPEVAQAVPTVALPAPSAEHPFSDPVWFPLREPARIGCTRSGCGTSADHGYFALDLLGRLGDPVHAAGAGIAHVGGNSGGCGRGGEVDGGRWVWIDHGGGVVSRYHHLDSIAVHDGERVTPATRIGTMGHSGDVPPCTTDYLHFEVRHGGLTGERVDPGQLAACVGGTQVRLPQALGFATWDDRGLHPVPRLSSPGSDSRCVEPTWTTTPSAPSVQVARAAGTITVDVAVPDGADAGTVDLQIWRPSLKAWRTLDTRSFEPGDPRAVFTEGVEDARRYRVRAALHGGGGWGAWSPLREAVGVPSAPRSRYLSWKKTRSATKSYLHVGWHRPDAQGAKVSAFTVQRRCGAGPATLGGWKSTKVKASRLYVNLRGLKKVKVCEVRVRGVATTGPGDWSAARTVRR